MSLYDIQMCISCVQVREIVVPSLYEGKKSSYAQDIALIDLDFSVRITNFIMPACVDWELKFKLTPGMFGTVSEINSLTNCFYPHLNSYHLVELYFQFNKHFCNCLTICLYKLKIDQLFTKQTPVSKNTRHMRKFLLIISWQHK